MRLSHSQRTSLASAARQYAQAIGLAEEYLAARGLSLEVAKRAGLGVVSEPIIGHEQYAGRLSIPYITPTGVVDIRFRALADVAPKYMGMPGAKTHIYNVRALLAAQDIIAVSGGELDAVTLSYAVGIPAVGIPGATNWKQHYRRLLQDFEKVFIFADGDPPGQDFARNIAKEVNGTVIINLPDGEDVNSMFVKHGESFFKEKVKYD